MKRAVVVTFLLAAFALVGAPYVVVTPANVAQAACDKVDAQKKPVQPNSDGTCPVDPFKPKDACVKIALPVFGTVDCVDNTKEGGAIVAYTKTILQLLGGAVGLVIIIMVVVAGIGYITAFGDPTQIKNAKGRLVNAITALLLYVMMYAIINFLVPGGIFS